MVRVALLAHLRTNERVWGPESADNKECWGSVSDPVVESMRSLCPSINYRKIRPCNYSSHRELMMMDQK